MTFVNEWQFSGASPTSPQTLAIAPVASHVLVWMTALQHNEAPTMSDTLGNSYTYIATVSYAAVGFLAYGYITSCAGGSGTLTVTSPSGGNVYGIYVGEHSGLGSFVNSIANPNQVPNSGATDIVTTGTVTGISASSVLIGLTATSSGGSTNVVSGTGFTGHAVLWTNFGDGRAEDKAVSANAAATFTPGTGEAFSGFTSVGMAFTVGGGGGAATQGYITQPGPGPTDPFNVNQFRLAPRSTLVLPPPPAPSIGLIQPPGPGIGPSKRYQFQVPSRDQNAAVPFFPGPTTPGIASMMLMFRKR